MQNTVQKDYMVAKALLEALEEEMNEKEQEYIADRKITNHGGEVPNYIWCIDDIDIFDTANEEFSGIIAKSGLWEKILSAKLRLKESEDALIQYGLSLVPQKEREILTRATRENYATRKKIIDLTAKLDVSSVISIVK